MQVFIFGAHDLETDKRCNQQHSNNWFPSGNCDKKVGGIESPMYATIALSAT